MQIELLSSHLLAWHPCEPWLAIGTSRGLERADPSGSVRCLVEVPDLNTIAFNPAGDLAISAEDTGFPGVQLRDACGALLWACDPEAGRIDEILFSADGERIACLGDLTAVLEGSTGRIVWTRERLVAATPYIEGLKAIYPRDVTDLPEAAEWGQQHLLVRYARAFELLDCDTGEVCDEQPREQPAGFRGVRCCADDWLDLPDRFARSHLFSPDGRQMVAEGSEHVVWLRDERGLRRVAGHPRTITAFAWSPSGDLYTSCRDGAIRRLIQDHFLVVEQLDEMVESIQWSADGRWIAYAGPAVVTIREAQGA